MKLIKHKTFASFLFILLFYFSSLTFANDILIYRVEKGDSLIKISNYFEIDLKELIALNNLDNPDLILTGQKIKIPQKTIKYNVKSGDSLNKIANIYNVKVNDIIRINKIKNPNKIFVGQILIIPINNKRNIHSSYSRNVNLNFIWPVQGKITSSFGWRLHPITHKREFHTGIDIGIPIGSPVYASEDGYVLYSGWSRGYGNLIIIQHRNNKQTYYAHNIELLVKKDDKIKQGRIIALSGNSGISTGPHLHFEIRTNNIAQDPMNYLNQKYLNNNFKV
jgi:murein DD-endopeptidase MepM/ murein hydrolase activator NlpD